MFARKKLAFESRKMKPWFASFRKKALKVEINLVDIQQSINLVKRPKLAMCHLSILSDFLSVCYLFTFRKTSWYVVSLVPVETNENQHVNLNNLNATHMT